MNKVILMGRLTRDPELRYSQSAQPVAVARYSLAVNRRFKREGEPDADFINIVAFGKSGEFAGKYFKKGMMVSVVGHLQVSSWEDQDKNRRWSTDVIVEEQHFAESKSSFEAHRQQGMNPMNQPAPQTNQPQEPSDGFFPMDEGLDEEDLPF